jgi:hypothetical protein
MADENGPVRNFEACSGCVPDRQTGVIVDNHMVGIYCKVIWSMIMCFAPIIIFTDVKNTVFFYSWGGM